MWNILVALHFISLALLTGGVFMNAFVVWPTAREVLGREEAFPLEFLIVEGRRIAPWVYTGLAAAVTSEIVMRIMDPPHGVQEIVLLLAKLLALGIMLGNTVYGTLSTWPRLQFSSSTESWALWKGYVFRAYITFGCGLFSLFLVSFSFTLR